MSQENKGRGKEFFLKDKCNHFIGVLFDKIIDV